MKIAVLCTGDEILKGSTVNTNLAYVGRQLMAEGIQVAFSAVVADAKEDIREGLRECLKRADVVISTGGLGPTADDLTLESVAEELHLTLHQDTASVDRVNDYWQRHHKGQPMPPRVLAQTLVPDGADVMKNEYGTAPGVRVDLPDGKVVFLLPGPPSEMEPMFDRFVLPWIVAHRKERLYAGIYRITGMGEVMVEERVQPLLKQYSLLSTAYCAQPGLVRLFLKSPDESVFHACEQEVLRLFAGNLLDSDSASPAEDVVNILRKLGAKVATAESCTGGFVGKMITDVPGASDVYPGGIISYANEVKHNMLGVSEDTLKQYGAVSPQTAKEMVEGLVKRFGTEAGISLTGIAGPGGGTPEKPVGLVYAGIHWKGRTDVHELHLFRSREQIRISAAMTALDLLRRRMLEK